MSLFGLEHITKENFPLSSACTMKTGGCAKYALFPETVGEFCAALDATADMKRRVVAGNASNLLFPDDAGDLCVIFTAKLSEIKKISDTKIFASCGAHLTSLAKFAAKESLSGLEFAFGIPGSVGGGVFMNAGAYGGEMSLVVENVTVYDAKSSDVFTLSAERCEFSYRHSAFMKNRDLYILGALFALKKGEKNEIEALCRKNMDARREKQRVEYPSCGSAFKRPEGYFAGKLIEDCGLKGYSVGGAQVSEKHAGFVINKGGATSADIRNLMKDVSDKVAEKFGVTLEPEIEMIEEKK